MAETIRLPEAVLKLLQLLRNAGFEAYAVGGCVRDSLLGREPKDWDVTTSALPGEIKAACSAYQTIDTGLKYGTVTVLTAEGPVEVTTYRTEAGYADSRHPDTVHFVRTLREDLKRRDFTVNAMAYNPWEGIIDLHNGLADLQAGILRCVGEPSLRFQEDALRILRALRFSSVKGFAIQPETAAAMRLLADRLRGIAPERIASEFCGFLSGSAAPGLLDAFWDVFAVFLPELVPMRGFAQHTPYHDADVWRHTLRVVAAVPGDTCLRLAALLHDIGKPAVFTLDRDGRGHFYGHEKVSVQIADTILHRLRLDKKTQARVLLLIQYHGVQIAPEEKAVKRWLNRVGAEALRELILLQRADTSGLAAPYCTERLAYFEQLENIRASVLEKGACFCVRDLAISGRDLLQCGMPEGKQIGSTLQMLVEAVIDGKVENQREALLQYIFS